MIEHKTNFDLRARVAVDGLKIKGIVVEIRITDSGVMYLVRYFDNAEARSVWFYQFELSEAK